MLYKKTVKQLKKLASLQYNEICVYWSITVITEPILQQNGDRVMMFNATFNNISAISCRSVVLVEETGRPGENHWPVTSHGQTLSHNVVSGTPCPDRDSNSGDRHWLHR